MAQGGPVAVHEFVTSVAEEVVSHLGGGLSEYVYRNALQEELRHRGHRAESEVVVPIYYKEVYVGFCRLDLRFVFMDRLCVLELKSKQHMTTADRVQCGVYRLHIKRDCEVLLVNFNLNGGVIVELM